MTAEEYSEFAIRRIAEAIAEAWNNRKVLYDDGSAHMYGKVDNTHFRGFDGPEDPRVEMMFSWNQDRKLTGIVLNAACTAQIIENENVISADYVGELRAMIKEKWGPDVSVLVMIGAAGDLAPRDLLRKERSPQSLEKKLRQAAQSLLDAIEKGLISARDQLEDPDTYFNTLTFDQKQEVFNYGAIQMRYELIQKTPFYTMELHTLRMGNTVLVKNPFELFTDYGIQLKARSAAKQTFVVQLACDACGYLPTSKAIASGGYSTQIFTGMIGDDGGHLLVDYTVSSIQELWDESNFY